MSEDINVQNENNEESGSEVFKIRREKFKTLKESGRNPFDKTTFACDALSKDIIENFENFDGKDVCIAGRIMSHRDMGKASFMDIADGSGKIQIYFNINGLGEEKYKEIINNEIENLYILNNEKKNIL